ncbi:MAG: hypothetical protein GMKNLPBB_02602 [Myxococcota bacterium]|nr:hypothetical protein [Myxococcota bacterium]
MRRIHARILLAAAILSAGSFYNCDCEEAPVDQLRPNIVISLKEEIDPGTKKPANREDLSSGEVVLNFGKVAKGATKTLSLHIWNDGSIELNISKSEITENTPLQEFQVLDTDRKISTSGKGEITVAYAPADLGPDQGTMIIESNSGVNQKIAVRLIAEGVARPVPEIEVCVGKDCNNDGAKELNIDFGTVALGQTVEKEFVIKNVGTLPLDLKPLALTQKDLKGDYLKALEFKLLAPVSPDPASLPLHTVPPEGEITVKVQYKPIDGGDDAGRAEIFSNDEPEEGQTENKENPAYVNFTAKGIAPKVCPKPLEVDFGEVLLSQSKDETLELCSCGTEPLKISDLRFETSSGDLRAAPPEPAIGGELKPGECVKVKITYTPSDAGSDGGKVIVTSNDPGAPQGEIPVIGVGKEPPSCKLRVTPSPLNFGQAPQGVPTERKFLIANLGESECTITAITDPTKPEFAIPAKPATPFNLKQGETKEVTVVFTPKNLGKYSDKVVVKESATGKDYEVLLEAEAVEKGDCKLQISPPPTTSGIGGTYSLLQFGNVAVGQNRQLPARFTNVGRNNCTLKDAKFGAQTGKEFGLVNPKMFPAQVGVGQTVDVQVFFRPTKVGAPGSSLIPGQEGCSLPSTRNCMIVNTDDPKQPNTVGGGFPGSCTGPGFPVVFRGCGTKSKLEVLPKEVDFGLVTLGCNSQDVTVTVYNNGTAPFNIIGLKTVSDPPFKIVKTNPATPLPITVNGGTTMQVVLRYKPTKIGKEQGELIITTDASNAGTNGETKVPLLGEGTNQSGQTDVFSQLSEPKVDVLWVIDNSGSMGDEQASVISNLSTFTSYAINLKVSYQIGVVSTDVEGRSAVLGGAAIVPGNLISRGGYPKIVSNTTPNPTQALASNMNLGTSGSGNEQGLESANLALSDPIINDPAANKGFLREDAKLVVIILSDEEDSSPSPVNYYVDFFRSIKGVRNTDLFSLSIIVGLDENTLKPANCGCQGAGGDCAAVAGRRYYEAYTQIGNGLALSICSAAWGKKMNALALDAFVSRVQFGLTRPADANSAKVKVNGREVPRDPKNGWDYDAGTNSIIFGEGAVPPRGAKIEVSYQAVCY